MSLLHPIYPLKVTKGGGGGCWIRSCPSVRMSVRQCVRLLSSYFFLFFVFSEPFTQLQVNFVWWSTMMIRRVKGKRLFCYLQSRGHIEDSTPQKEMAVRSISYELLYFLQPNCCDVTSSSTRVACEAFELLSSRSRSQ